MSNWNGTILGPPHVTSPPTRYPSPVLAAFAPSPQPTANKPQSVHENRIYSVKMHCGENYPDEPPTLQFVSQVNLPCVNPRNGMVDPKGLPCLANWQRNNTMETALIELRRYVPVPLLKAYTLFYPRRSRRCLASLPVFSPTRARLLSHIPPAQPLPPCQPCQANPFAGSDTWPPPPTKRSPSPPRAPSTRTPRRPTNREATHEAKRGRRTPLWPGSHQGAEARE